MSAPTQRPVERQQRPRRATFGLLFYPTANTLQPAQIAEWAEERGFESLFFPEHSHIPLPFPKNLPSHFREWYDPFIALASAASVTRELRLGTAICLVPEHHPIHLAKTAATIDRISSGRLILGVGAGWNAGALANFGVLFDDRWAVTLERIDAMRRIWSVPDAGFRGKFVSFGPIACEPTPLARRGPPVLLGVGSPGHSKGRRSPASTVRTPTWFAQVAVSHCDGWIPSRRPQDMPYDDLARGVEAIAHEADRVGRPMSDLDLTVIDMSEDSMQREPRFEGTRERIHRFISLGFNRVLFAIEPGRPSQQLRVLERYADLIEPVPQGARQRTADSPPEDKELR